MNRSLTLLLLALLGGCVLYGGKGLEVEPAGPLYAGESVRLTVRGPCSRVTISLGGEDAGTYRANTPIEVVVPAGVGAGAHRMRVTAVDSDVALSAERDVQVVPGSPVVVSVLPPVGTTTTLAPFRIEVTFSHAILPERLSAPWIELSAQQGSLPPPALSSDRRSLSIELPKALWELGGTVRLAVSRSVFGPERDGPPWVLSWTVPRLVLAVESPAAPVITNGPVTVRLAVDAASTTATVASLRLRAKNRQTLVETEVAAAEYTATGSTIELTWDTNAWAQGVYDLSLVASPPVALSVPALPPVTVDRGAPGLVSCTLEAPGVDGAFVNGCIMVRADEPFALPPPPRILLGGLQRTATIERVTFSDQSTARVCPFAMDPVDPFALSEVEELTELTLADSAGNVATGLRCSVAVPVWIAPWEAGPVLGVSSAPGGLGLDLHRRCGWGWDRDLAGGVFVRPDGTVQAVLSEAPAPWQITGPQNATSGSVATEAFEGHWIERVGSGPGQVRVGSRVFNLDQEGDAAGLTAVPGVHWLNEFDSTGAALVWTEAAPGGRRAIVEYDGTRTHLGPPASVGNDVHEVASAHAQPGMANEVGFTFHPVFVWTEAPPGGLRRLRAAWWGVSGTWEGLPSVDNLNASLDAWQPSVWDGSGDAAVAWREGGVVYARVSVGTEFGSAAVLNADPARAARHPLLDRLHPRPRVYFLEEVDGGDVIHVREWDGGAWRLLPFPVNADAPGPVSDFMVKDGVVAWVDPSGAVRVRRTDCF